MDEQERFEAAEAKVSADADAWHRQLVLGLAIANGLGLTSQIGLLQAVHSGLSEAALGLTGPASMFALGLAFSAGATLAAAQAASALGQALFAQKQAQLEQARLMPSGLSFLMDAQKFGRRSDRLDKSMMWLSIVAAGFFFVGVGWTFLAIYQGVLGRD